MVPSVLHNMSQVEHIKKCNIIDSENKRDTIFLMNDSKIANLKCNSYSYRSTGPSTLPSTHSFTRIPHYLAKAELLTACYSYMLTSYIHTVIH